MENKFKRFLSLALAMLMVFSMMPQITLGASALSGDTVYFTNNQSWGTVNIYYWGGSSSVSWPGVAMTYSHTNDYSQSVYSYEVPSDATYIIFNNGSEQTVDIALADNDYNAYYLTSKSDGKWSVGTWCNHRCEGGVVAGGNWDCTVGTSAVYSCLYCSYSYDVAVEAEDAHDYSDGTCTRCGMEEPAEEESVPELTEEQLEDLCLITWECGENGYDTMASDETVVTYGAVTKNDSGSYICELTVDTEEEEPFAVDGLEHEDGGYTHTFENVPESVTVTATWNAESEEWVVEPITYTATCTAKECEHEYEYECSTTCKKCSEGGRTAKCYGSYELPEDYDCTKSVTVNVVCDYCNQSYTETIAANESHNYSNGVCLECGATEPAVEETYVAYIGEQGYTTFAAAYNAANEGEAITVKSNVEFTDDFTFAKAVTVTTDSDVYLVHIDGDLVISDGIFNAYFASASGGTAPSVTISGGTFKGSHFFTGEVSISGGTFTTGVTAANGCTGISISGGTFTNVTYGNVSTTISGGTFANGVSGNPGVLTLTGGTFPNQISGCTIADGYEWKANDNGTYSVVATATEEVAPVVTFPAYDSNMSVGEETYNAVVGDASSNEAAKNFTLDTDVVSALTITLKDVEQNTTTGAVKVSYDVTPTWVGGAKEITFRLPVTGMVEKVNIYHEGTLHASAVEVKEENGGRYVEVTSSSFSVYTVEDYVATEETYPAKIGTVGYESFSEALTAASSMTGAVEIEIYDKVTLSTALSGSYDSITFVGKDTDAEIYLDVQGYITASGKAVAFEDLTLSKSEGGFITNVGFMNVAFGIYNVNSVDYTNCVFSNGAYASSGEVTFTGCTFYQSWDKYGLWAYGDADITVSGCTFAGPRGIKMYAEDQAKTTVLTVTNTDFSKATGSDSVSAKPAIVLTYGESVTLSGNTYSSNGTFELDKDGDPNGTAVTSDVAPVCVNDDGACGVLVDGKIYTTVADAVEAANEDGTSSVTVLYSTADTAEFPAGTTLTLATNVTADNVTVQTYKASIGEQGYTSLAEAVAAASSGDTITLSDGNHTMAIGSDVSLQNKTLTFEGSRNAIIDATKVDERDQYVTGATLTFNGVTVNFGTANYMGFANYAALTYNDCAINGLQFAYGTGAMTFTNCDLNSNGAEHCLWTWGGENISFTGCSFTYADRAVNCYGEGVDTDISFTDCSFTYTGTSEDHKGAIEINSSTLKSMDVEINDCTTTNESNLWFISQWDSKGGKNTVVTVDDKIVWQVLPAATIGDAKYYTIAEAIAAAQDGETVTIMAGEYDPINISNKNITIAGTVGENGELLTTIKGGNPAITGHGFNGTIKNLKIVDAWKVMYAEPAGNVTVDNIYVTGATYGLHLIAYSEGLTWTIQDSYMDLSWANSFGASGGDAAIVIKGNEFASTKPYYADYGALPVNTFLPNVTVQNNVFGENTKIALSVSDTSNVTVSANYHADGVDNAFASDSDATVYINEYYADEAMTNLVKRYAQIDERYYATLTEAAAAAKSGEEIILLGDVTESVTLPDGVIFNGNGYTVNGNVTVDGALTIKGITKVTKFSAAGGDVVTIGAGASLQITGSDRMVIGHGATFNITGSIENAKAADAASITPSLIAPGASITGAGVTFNVTNALVKFTAYCSTKNSVASGTFNFNISNSIWDQSGKLAFEVPSSGKDPTVNFTLKDSVLNTASHLVFAVSKGEIVFDNSNVNVGNYRQLENRSTLTVKNGSEVWASVATSSNAINPGTLIIEDATYAATGDFTGSTVGTGTLQVNKDASFTATKITNADIVIDATGMEAGEVTMIKADLAAFTGEVTVINSDMKAVVDTTNDKITLVGPVAYIDAAPYYTLQEAFEAVADGETIKLATDITIDENSCVSSGDNWYEGAYYNGDASFTIDLNGKTITNVDGDINDYLLLFKNVGSKANEITIKNGTINSVGTYSAVCTSSSSTQIITINLDDVTVTNTRTDGYGDVLRVRGGAVMNINDGATVTGNGVYVSAYSVKATVNIYDGAEIYMNETTSYVGAVVGASNGGTVNAYGGYGKGTQGCFIVMTTGGTINVEGGTWIADSGNTGNEGNHSVLIAQNSTYEDDWVDKSIINVTGGTFTGKYNCYGVAAGDSAINISGGTYSTEIPAEYCALGYVPTSYVENGVTVYSVKAAVEAKIGRVSYTTLAEAIAAAKDGDTILLQADVHVDSVIEISKNITIADYTTYSITTVDGGAFHITGSNALTLDDVIVNANVYADSNIAGATISGQIVNGVEGEMSKVVSDGATVAVTNPAWVAAVNNVYYSDLAEAFKVGGTITLLDNVTVTDKWDIRYNGANFTEAVTIDGNGKTITITDEINDGGNYNAVFRFNADATVKNLTIDVSKATATYKRIRAISSGANLTVENCTFIGSEAVSNDIAIIYGEGAGTNIGNVTVSVTGSTFTNWRRGLSDNENAQDVKAVTATGNTFTNAPVYVSAAETVTFTGNTAAYVNITSYSATNALSVTATGNTLAEGGTYLIKAQAADAQEEFVVKHPVSTYAELVAAITAAKEGETVLMTADIDCGSNQLAIAKAITLDLGGNTLTTGNNWGGMSVKGNPTIKNGTIVHTGNTAAIKVWNAESFENLTIEVSTYTEGKVKGGIVLQSSTTTRVGSMKNVTIKGAGLTNGIETYNCGDATADVIGSMENVTIDAIGTAMLISAPVGTATNCTFEGDVNGIEIWIKGTYSASLTLESCTVVGGVSAHDEYNSADITNAGSLTLTVDETTTGASVSDVTLTINHAEEEQVGGVLGDVIEQAVAKVNGTYYLTLQAAVDAANAGDTVEIIKAGTYTLPALKEKQITVIGETNEDGTPAVVLEGTLTGTLEDLTLKNLHITSGNAMRWAYAKGDVTFENVTFEATSVYAMHFDGITEGANVMVKNCTIIGWVAMGGSPASFVFDSCTIKDNGSYGLIRSYFNTTIKNCTFDVDGANTADAFPDGIQSCGTATITVTDCTNSNGEMIDLINVHKMSVVVLDDVTIWNVATIGDTYYRDLHEALTAAKKGDTVLLLRDVDLKSEEWTPVDNFQATFDGQNYTISNLVVNGGSNNNQGLFGKTTDGEIKNLTINHAKVSGRLNVGVVAGTPYTSKYSNIKVTGHVEVNGMAYVGGVGGKNAYANWTDITVDVDDSSYVKATSTENGTAYRTYVGGVIGFIGEGGHTFTNISSNIKVIGDVKDIGGLFGIAHYGNNFVNVTFTGSVVAPEGAQEVGGIAGVWNNTKGYNVSFTNVTSTGTVTIGTETTTGSIVGGAYYPDNRSNSNSGGLYIDGNEVWLCVAKIGDNYYQTVADALTAAADGETIELIWAEGDAAIPMNGQLSGKTVTITGTAKVNWEKGYLYVGRTTSGTAEDATLIFENANITSAVAGDHGIHVSGAEANSSTKKNGTVKIIGSNVEISYVNNRSAMVLENSTLTVQRAFNSHGRNASESVTGNNASAVVTMTNSTLNVLCNDPYQCLNLGGESTGIVNMDATSVLNAYKVNVETYGILNINGGTVNATNIVNGGFVNVNAVNNDNSATVKVTNLVNNRVVNLYGNSTVQVEKLTRGETGYFNIRDGAVLNNSYIKGNVNLYGNVTFNGGFECVYMQTSDTCTITIEEGTTVKATYGVNCSASCTLNGGTLEVSMGDTNWGLVFQNNTYVINSDIVVNGNGKTAPIHFTNATATINGKITQTNSGGEPMHIGTNSVVTLGKDAEIDVLSIHGAGKLIIDAEGMTAGEYANVTCTASGFTGTLEVINNADLYAQIIDGKIWLVAYVAKIGEVGYATLQEAIDAAVDGDTINLMTDCAENVTVTQAENYAITIDGNDKTYTGSITVNGKTAAYATTALTIKNVNFVADNITTDACINLGAKGDNNTRYTSNVTVENCTFTGTDNTAAAIKNYTGGDKNLTITGCTATGMHSLAQLKGVDNVKVSNVTVNNGKNGISLGTSTNVEIANANITATGYGIRADGDGAYGPLTVTGSNISAQQPIVVRKTAAAYMVNVDASNTLTAADGYAAVTFTAGDDGTQVAPSVTLSMNVAATISVFPACEAKIGTAHYASVEAAIEAAKAGDTVTLVTDAEVTNLVLYSGIDLDLAGKTLTVTGYAAAFNGNNIIDTVGGGLLKTTANVMIQKTNTYLPIWDETNGGYAFADLDNFREVKSTDTVNNRETYIFLPYLDAAEYALIGKGAEVSGVTMKVEVSWTRTDGSTAAVTFVYTDELMATFAERYPTEDRSAFKLELSGTNGKVLSYRVFFESDTGVILNCN